MKFDEYSSILSSKKFDNEVLTDFLYLSSAKERKSCNLENAAK